MQLIMQEVNRGCENEFVKEGRIPLGINTYHGNKEIKSHIVSLPYRKNGSIVILGGSGWGKSVLLKRVINYDLGLYTRNRAGLIIDTQGVDHRLLGEPNERYKPLFVNYGERPTGIKNIKNFCPVFASNISEKEDNVWGITLNDLDVSDLHSSNMTTSGVVEFFKIKQESMNNRKLMDDPLKFYKNFARIRSAKSDAGETELDYEDGIINYGLKMSMLNTFSWWAGFSPEDDERRPHETEEEFNIKKRPPYFVSIDDKRYKPTFTEEWNKKTVVVNNFMEAKRERDGMNIYGGYLLRNAYNYCRVNKKRYGRRFGGMLIVVEESNMFIDEDEKKGCNYYFTECLCRGFKYEIKIIANFQNITGINRDIKEHLTSGTHPVIIGKLTKSDREFLSSIFPNIHNLNLRPQKKLDDNMQWGANEWAVYYNDQEYDTFVPYPSLSKIHERG